MMSPCQPAGTRKKGMMRGAFFVTYCKSARQNVYFFCFFLCFSAVQISKAPEIKAVILLRQTKKWQWSLKYWKGGGIGNTHISKQASRV